VLFNENPLLSTVLDDAYTIYKIEKILFDDDEEEPVLNAMIRSAINENKQGLITEDLRNQ
jgi:hypothetical protein